MLLYKKNYHQIFSDFFSACFSDPFFFVAWDAALVDLGERISCTDVDGQIFNFSSEQ